MWSSVRKLFHHSRELEGGGSQIQIIIRGDYPQPIPVPKQSLRPIREGDVTDAPPISTSADGPAGGQELSIGACNGEVEDHPLRAGFRLPGLR